MARASLLYWPCLQAPLALPLGAPPRARKPDEATLRRIIGSMEKGVSVGSLTASLEKIAQHFSDFRWPRLGQQLTRAHQGYIKAKEVYERLRTRREKLVIWRKAEKAVRALDEQLTPTVRGYMIGHEELACKKKKSVAAASVQGDLEDASRACGAAHQQHHL